MNRYGRIGLIFLVILVACTPQPHSATPNASTQAGGSVLILATTTSTQDSGLLDVLIPRFEAQSGYQVKTIAVGSGQALKMGEEGNADVLLVHSPQAEEAFMQAGWGKDRVRVMHNDFVLLGPPADPAQIRGLDVATALRTIAEKGVLFVLRGDNSGTHALELSLWRRLNLDPQGQPWYLETGQGMGATLMVAAEKQAYTLSDRETQTTTLLVTHDLDEARRLGTRLGIVLAGRIVQMGAPEEVLARAAGEQVGAYLKHSPPNRAFNR